MTRGERGLLLQAADDVEAGRRGTDDADTRDRLEELAGQLRSQAERNTTPALGALDRIQHALEEVAAGSEDEAVSGHLETARERIFSFLGTLDDRGMRQHERGRNG